MVRLSALHASLVALLGLGALALAVPACGGDDDLPPSPGEEQDEPPPPDPPSERRPGGGGGGGAPPSYEIDVDCPIGTVVEREPNDTPETATELGDDDLSFCGAISPGTDVDYSTFTTPPGKKLTVFQAVIDGKVDFELVVGETKIKPNETGKFKAGTYVVKAFTSDSQPGKYRYRIQYEP